MRSSDVPKMPYMGASRSNRATRHSPLPVGAPDGHTGPASPPSAPPSSPPSPPPPPSPPSPPPPPPSEQAPDVTQVLYAPSKSQHPANSAPAAHDKRRRNGQLRFMASSRSAPRPRLAVRRTSPRTAP